MMPAKKKPVKKKVIENQQFSYSVSTDLRDAFVQCCKDQDTNASRELRGYMRRYIAKNGQEKLI